MRPLPKLFLGLLALTSLVATAAVAQHPISKALIREQVNDNQLTVLKGNTPPAAIAQNDVGRVNGNMPMSDLILVLRRSPEVQAAFDAFVERQYDPNSANFHQWLTPEQVGEKFGPAATDISTVSSWLSGHGLSVDGVSKDRMTIRFSGTARQVEATFHTELHNLTVKGEAHFSNMSDPQIPMALEPVVLGPKALHNFIPRPLHRTGGKAALNQETGKWQRIAEPGVATASIPKADAVFNGAHPDIVFTCTGTGCLEEDLTPYDFATIYNLTPLWSAGVDGTNQTIAIAGRSDVRSTDVSSFRNTFGLTGGSYTQINNGTDPGNCTSTATNALCTLDDQIENALDVEWVGATAPKAAVKLVVTQQTSTNDAIYLSAKYAIDNSVAKIINVSYGLCELGMGTSNNAAYNSLWQTAETAGIAVFVATGDSGSPGCDQGQASQGPYGAQFGLAVSGIASTPHNTAVGGTDLNWTTASTYWNSSSDSHGANAKGYIPEIPWNDTCTNPLEVAFINQALSTSDSASTICNKIANGAITSSSNPQSVLDLVNTVGAGGGKSNCTTSDGANVASCTGGYAKPSWQTGVSGIPNDSKRDVPDVSFFAGNGFLNSAYLICVSDWGTCVTSTGAATEPSVGEIGGTSAASPAMAGIMALINQKAGSAQGNPNSQLYQLAAKQNYANCKTESAANSGACYFNDIDTGTISMPCAGGSPNCSLAAVSTGNTIGVLSGFDATAGFDNATGLGSMNVANVVNAWTATGFAIATVNVTATPTTFSTEQGTVVTVAVTGSGGTPTGSVFLKSDSFTSATQTLLADGTTSFNISPGVLAAGTDNISALYSGDSVYAAGAGSKTVTVTQVGYTVSATNPAATVKGGSAVSTVTVAATNGYTGTVTLSCAPTSSPAGATNAPSCTMTGSPVTLTASSTSGTATATVKTTAATSASLARPHVNGWAETGGTAIVALLVFFGIPARQRGWRGLFGILVLLLTIGSISACGGGGGSSGGGGGGNPGTTSGTYTFTVTSTGNPQISPKPAGTFTLIVN
jgi:subtilase family serine protease